MEMTETKVMVGPPSPFIPSTITSSLQRLCYFSFSVFVLLRNEAESSHSTISSLILSSGFTHEEPTSVSTVSLHGPPFPDVFLFVIAAIFQPCALVSSASSVLI